MELDEVVHGQYGQGGHAEVTLSAHAWSHTCTFEPRACMLHMRSLYLIVLAVVEAAVVVVVVEEVEVVVVVAAVE